MPVVAVTYTGDIGSELKDNWKKSIRGSKNLRYKVYRPNYSEPCVPTFCPSVEKITENRLSQETLAEGSTDDSFDETTKPNSWLDDSSFYIVTRGPALLPTFAPVSEEKLKMWNDFDDLLI